MKFLAYLVFPLGLTLTPAMAEDPADAWLTDIKWYDKPSGEDMAKAYPGQALADKRGGWAILSCRIGQDRRPTGCKVAAEGPEGYRFGAASLAIADEFRLEKPKEGQSFEGRRVRIPITWHHWEGDTAPKNYPAGEPSMIVQVAAARTDKRRTFPCPSKAAPERQCLAFPVTWTTRPEIEKLAELIRRGGDGVSMLECSIDASGGLEMCKAANSSPGVSDEELLSLAKLFNSAPTANDDIPTAGQRVMLTFDWKVLRKALEVFEAT